MSGFASTNDLADKKVSFEELGPGLYGYTAEGDPNSGVVIGDDSVLVVDAQATPAMAADVIARIRAVTDKPIRHVVLSHYHAVRVLGASAYAGAEIIASDVTRDLIVERGQQDMDSEIGRFPRLFRGRDSIPGLTWPTLTFHRRMTLFLGKREVQIIHIGRSHTAGDTVVWLPHERVLFSGDCVEYGATPYCGDAHYTDWPATLDAIRALKPERLVPGRGRSLIDAREVAEAIDGTAAFTSDLFGRVRQGVAQGWDLTRVYADTMDFMRLTYGHWVIFEHCMPFDVARAFDEASGIDHPRIWTAERDIEMWRALEQRT
jgi:glyoxylase-like metal-dependent hydrolase (beta-lactamase superfamily II)